MHCEEGRWEAWTPVGERSGPSERKIVSELGEAVGESQRPSHSEEGRSVRRAVRELEGSSESGKGHRRARG